MSSKAHILKRLRENPLPFPAAQPRPETYLPVIRLDSTDAESLITRFAAELEALQGKAYIVPDQAAAITAVLDIVGEAQSVLAWEDLPLPGLGDALAARHIQVITPQVRGEERRAVADGIDPVQIGITGADAAFATTGTLVLAARAKQGRLPSLLPASHIALLPRERLYPRLEDWLNAEGQAALTWSRSIVLVTGPSKTGDIEMKIVFGVHGPKHLHVVIF